MKKAWLNWSSGKDSAMALYSVLQSNELAVEKLFTTITKDSGKVSMHGVPISLLQRQADNIGIPLQVFDIPTENSKDTYDQKMEKVVQGFKFEGFTHSVFGDIFLKDLKSYRENQLSKLDIKAVFPLWHKKTEDLMETFLDSGFKAIVVCTNSKYLDESFCGRHITREFLKDLPKNVDPCGENGEFHTFVFDGPIFRKPINYKTGEKYSKSYKTEGNTGWDTEFCYCELISVS